MGQGGIAGRTESTGLGVYYCIKELLNTDTFLKKCGDKKVGIEGKTFTVQGFGNVGYWAAKFLEKDGGKITTIIERDGAIYNSSGFDVEDVKAYMIDNKGCVVGYPEAEETITDDPLSALTREVDYIIPAAVELSINKFNAPHIKCKGIFEGANGPTSF